jgi:hypothetical protein
MYEIEKPICELSQNPLRNDISPFKTFWELAFKTGGLSAYTDLFCLDAVKLREILIYEMIISQIIRKEMAEGRHYKEIYKDCKARLESLKDLAYLQAV